MTSTGLRLQDVTLGYDGRVVCEDVDFVLPEGEFTAIIGPNGCGKSTLLKALGRTLRPWSGRVLLDGTDIRSMRPAQVARRLASLPQHPIAPESLRVRDLVARGRHPYHSLLRQWLPGDAAIVAEAMAATGVADQADRLLAELSGGQRQRAWIAMVLAQQTRLLLLDEPTTFLDLAHQLDILYLCRTLADDRGRTVVAVVHDLAHACRYADHLIAMRDGQVVATGTPAEVITTQLVKDVFDVDAMIIDDPASGTPLVVPIRTATP